MARIARRSIGFNYKRSDKDVMKRSVSEKDVIFRAFDINLEEVDSIYTQRLQCCTQRFGCNGDLSRVGCPERVISRRPAADIGRIKVDHSALGRNGLVEALDTLRCKIMV